ncbi:MAG TPA: polysaccharide deacetylase family protein [Armatimonadota bacterium]|jgi:hypothetical protein
MLELLALAVAAALAAVEPTPYSQLLEPPAGRFLIVHADDMGMCHSENQASFQAMEKGLVTCGSVMMPCPWVMEVVEYAKTHPKADLGVHLTLNCEWRTYKWGPVAPREKVKGLLDPQGYLWSSAEDTLKHATAEEVETECRAQIQRALDLGLKITHIDTHMGTIVARPDFARVYLKLAHEFHVPALVADIFPKDRALTAEESGLRDALLGSGLPLLDGLTPSVREKEPEPRRETYGRMLSNLKPGVWQTIIHLGMGDDEMRAITGSAGERHGDYLAFTHEETRKLIQSKGIKLIGYRDLKAAMDRSALTPPAPLPETGRGGAQ